METTGKWLLAMALATMACASAYAETDRAGNELPMLKTAAWERVGDASTNAQPADAVKAQAPGEERLRARKADMVRRMFWIMMAHR